MTIHEEVARWLMEGDVGSSSKTIVARVCGFLHEHDTPPWDSYDFQRCLRMMESCPSVAALFADTMSLDPEWASLVAEWPSLTAILAREAPDWRRAWAWVPEINDRLRVLRDSKEGM